MRKMPFEKYQAFPPIHLPDRQWPNKVITQAPAWCSVDLRDGNQALIEPMSPFKKRQMFELLLTMGFKEIEVGFPSASQTDFDFLRMLIDDNLIPQDVTIQMLVQSREPLIRRTFEALAGSKRSIVHLYNSTSTLQRKVVFGMDKPGIVALAVEGAKMIKQFAADSDSEIVLEYSPESFTGTELDFAVEICDAVMNVWQPSPTRKMIVNLPATVEMASPNVYADQIEWFCRHLPGRDSAIISIHPHNDRGTAVAASELAIMAGGERIEGTLFGNGERTGNTDIVTLGMNLLTQGVDPQLDLSDIDTIRKVAETCTQLPVHPRHPYAGELVFTAFSGSHQDAIKKGLSALRQARGNIWEVPYLPVDPSDLGRSYEAVIRINSQSGKGGVAYLLEQEHGVVLPRGMQVEFSRVIQQAADASGKELSADFIWQSFQREYLAPTQPFALVRHSIDHSVEPCIINAVIRRDGVEQAIQGRGNGPIAAFVDALTQHCGVTVTVADYHEHAIGQGADAQAAAYVEVSAPAGGTMFGAGLDSDIVAATLRAVISAVNRIARDYGAA